MNRQACKRSVTPLRWNRIEVEVEGESIAMELPQLGPEDLRALDAYVRERYPLPTDGER